MQWVFEKNKTKINKDSGSLMSLIIIGYEGEGIYPRKANIPMTIIAKKRLTDTSRICFFKKGIVPVVFSPRLLFILFFYLYQ